MIRFVGAFSMKMIEGETFSPALGGGGRMAKELRGRRESCWICWRRGGREVGVDKEEEEGRAFVFRPSREMDIALTEKDWHKLRAMYELGYADAVENGEKLKAYLKGSEIEE